MIAMYQTTCRRCAKLIVPGNRIKRVNGKIVHLDPCDKASGYVEKARTSAAQQRLTVANAFWETQHRLVDDLCRHDSRRWGDFRQRVAAELLAHPRIPGTVALVPSGLKCQVCAVVAAPGRKRCDRHLRRAAELKRLAYISRKRKSTA